MFWMRVLCFDEALYGATYGNLCSDKATRGKVVDDVKKRGNGVFPFPCHLIIVVRKSMSGLAYRTPPLVPSTG